MQRLLDSSEIIKIATEIQSPGMSYEDAHRLIAAEIQQPGTKFFRQGNTLFIIHSTENSDITRSIDLANRPACCWLIASNPSAGKP